MRSGGANGIPVTDNVDDASGWTQVTRKSRPRSAQQQQTSGSFVLGQDPTSGIQKQQTSSDLNGGSAGKITLMIQVSLPSSMERTLPSFYLEAIIMINNVRNNQIYRCSE